MTEVICSVCQAAVSSDEGEARLLEQDGQVQHALYTEGSLQCIVSPGEESKNSTVYSFIYHFILLLKGLI